MVTEECGEAHTINLCKRCDNERLVRQGKQPVKAAEWREIVECEAFRGKLWKVLRWNNVCAECENTSPSKMPRKRSRKVFKVSDSRSALSRKSWSKFKGTPTWFPMPT